MLDQLLMSWLRLPLWAKWASAICVLVLLDSIRFAWGERDFVDGVVQTFVASIFYYGGMFAGVGTGIWVGIRVAEKSNKNWLGWFVGVIAATVVYGLIDRTASALPGVDWRVKAMRDSNCYTEWDGRSNPVVCE